MTFEQILDEALKENTSVIGLDNGGDGEPDLWQLNTHQLLNLKAKLLAAHTAEVRTAENKAALFALDNETMWQFQRKCNAGEASKANRKWLLELIQRNIDRYRAALQQPERIEE